MSLSTILTDPDRKVLQGQVVHQTCWGKAVNQKNGYTPENGHWGPGLSTGEPPSCSGSATEGLAVPFTQHLGQDLNFTDLVSAIAHCNGKRKRWGKLNFFEQQQLIVFHFSLL